MYYASDEWRKLFDAWSLFSFKIAGFEIVRTPEMGLGVIINTYIFLYLNFLFPLINEGVRATRRISMQMLSSKIAGFLEYIPRNNFKHLQKLQYKSLYSFDYVDPDESIPVSQQVRKTYFFILFGPLALCNADNQINVSFFNFDDADGSLLIWKSVLKMSAEQNECDIETISAFNSSDGLSITDGTLSPTPDTYVTYSVSGMSSLKHVFVTDGPDSKREKVEFYVKVILHHRSKAAFKGHMYEEDEEIFVKYNLADRQIL